MFLTFDIARFVITFWKACDEHEDCGDGWVKLPIKADKLLPTFLSALIRFKSPEGMVAIDADKDLCDFFLGLSEILIPTMSKSPGLGSKDFWEYQLQLLNSKTEDEIITSLVSLLEHFASPGGNHILAFLSCFDIVGELIAVLNMYENISKDVKDDIHRLSQDILLLKCEYYSLDSYKSREDVIYKEISEERMVENGIIHSKLKYE